MWTVKQHEIPSLCLVFCTFFSVPFCMREIYADTQYPSLASFRARHYSHHMFFYFSIKVPRVRVRAESSPNPLRLSDTRSGQSPLHHLILASFHEIQAPGEILLQPELCPEERTRLLQPLDVPAHLPRRILRAHRRQAQPHNIEHAFIQPSVEVCPVASVRFVVPALVAAVGVQVAAEFYEELEGERGAAGEGGEVFD